jgi:hypothetical protein
MISLPTLWVFMRLNVLIHFKVLRTKLAHGATETLALINNYKKLSIKWCHQMEWVENILATSVILCAKQVPPTAEPHLSLEPAADCS